MDGNQSPATPAPAAAPPASSPPENTSAAKTNKNKRWFRYKKILVLIILLAVAISAWLIWHRDSGWATYTSKRYGLKFSYPKAWALGGAPKVSSRPLPGDNIFGYAINFSPKLSNQSQSYGVNVYFMPDDYQEAFCNSSLKTNPCALFTKAAVEKTLSGEKIDFVASDNSSYAVIKSFPPSGPRKLIFMEAYQIVNLPKLKASVARGEVIKGSGDVSHCSTAQLANSSDTNCINKAVYSSLNRMLKSIKPV